MIDIARRFIPGALLVVGVFVLSGAEVQCGSAEAQPGLPGLQAQIDELRARELRVFDGDGFDIGRLITWDSVVPGRLVASVYIESIEAVAHVLRDTGLLQEASTVIFTTFNCTGQPYIFRGNGSVLITVDNRSRYFVSIPGAELLAPPVPSAGSHLNMNGCFPLSGQVSSLPAREVTDELTVAFPLVLPLTIGVGQE